MIHQFCYILKKNMKIKVRTAKQLAQKPFQVSSLYEDHLLLLIRSALKVV
jgi:hypothetical protein